MIHGSCSGCRARVQTLSLRGCGIPTLLPDRDLARDTLGRKTRIPAAGLFPLVDERGIIYSCCIIHYCWYVCASFYTQSSFLQNPMFLRNWTTSSFRWPLISIWFVTLFTLTSFSETPRASATSKRRACRFPSPFLSKVFFKLPPRYLLSYTAMLFIRLRPTK